MNSRTAFDVATAPLGPGVRVLASAPCGLVALEKPSGVLAHPNRAADRARALFTAPFRERDECFEWSDAAGDGVLRRAWLLHRLDSATSGVMLVALAADVAAAVREAFEQRQVTKQYLAVVLGHPREKRSLWRDTIAVDRGGGVARARSATQSRGGLSAEAAMRVVRLVPGPPALAVIELEPHTGRTHQLRLQCAQRRLPILGDQNYGNFRANRELARRFGTDRLFLHAASVALEFTLAGKVIRFSASSAVPAEFSRFIDAGRK